MKMNSGTCLAVVGASCCCTIVLFIVGVYSAVLYNKFSPVYADIDCGDEVISFKGGSISSFTSISVGLSVILTCTNPNPYPVRIKDPKVGKVYLANGMRELGTIAAKPGMIKEGGGQVVLDAEIKVSGFSALTIISRLLRGSVHVFLEVDFTCVIEESMLVTSFRVTPMFQQKCGVTLDIAGRETGDVVCGDSFSDLVITDIGVQLKPGLSSMGVDQAIIDNGTRDKNLYLGLAIALSFSFIFLILVGMSFLAFRITRKQTYNKTIVAGASCPQVTTVGASVP